MTWVDVPADSPFGVENLPYGVFSQPSQAPRVGVAIGDHILDLAGLTAAGLLERATGSEADRWFTGGSLNAFLAAGRPRWRAVRAQLTELLTGRRHADAVRGHLVDRAAAVMHLPWQVADYVDFYASEQHATNVGRIFRPDGDPLTPNWKHLPIGYHGRAGTVVVSGTPVVRPCGQRKAPSDPAPVFGPSTRLDIEAEVGFVVGVPTGLGERVGVDRFADHVFGAVLVNDWSARDIQAWEYVPLGPFLGKSFATSVSPWVVDLDALAAARVSPPAQSPEPLPYLRGSSAEAERWGLDLELEVRINSTVVSRPPFAGMYWTAAQQLAHLTVNGASLRTGDLYASGTVSGDRPDQLGCLLELTRAGAEPVRLADGTTRAFLADGDTVSISATAPGAGGGRIGFGSVVGEVLPPRH